MSIRGLIVVGLSCWLAVIALLLLAAPSAASLQSTGMVYGTVVSGEVPVAGATVRV